VKSACALPALAVFLFSAAPAFAQAGAMIQSTPPAMAVQRLNDNLTRLSRSPTDVEALIGAGMAAYELGDAQAANGFFMRADMANPRVGRVKLGLALVALQLKQPGEAVENFDAAARLGETANAFLGERALAYDLVGQQDKAQRDYAAALRARPGDKDIIRNYAVSLGVSGRVAEAEAMIRPLLFQSDRAAWRDRAMILAMNGRTAEARRITQTVMPRSLAEAMDPYLQRMSGLTPVQKVAATHYGQFPADGLRMAPPAAAPPQAPVLAKLDRHGRRKNDRDQGAAASVTPVEDSRLAAAMPRADAAPAMIQPAPQQPAPRPMADRDGSGDEDPYGWSGAERWARRQSPPAAQSASPRPVARAPQAQTILPPPRAMAPASPRPVQPAPAPTPRSPAPVMGPPAPPVASPPQPGFSVPVTAGAAVAPTAPSQTRSLAAIMAGIEVPESERKAGPAVDLAEIARLKAERRKAEAAAAAKSAADKAKKEAAAKAKAEAAAEAKAEAEEKARLKANPQRYWVQVATGRDPAALAFDLRRLRKTYAALADLEGWSAQWGVTRRLLVGPFAKPGKAKAVETELRKAGTDSFVWQSDAGEVVTALSRK